MDDVRRAAEILRNGGLVAFPTETVYGLGADATNAMAVERIFTVKGRPPTNPTIVHVADATVAQRYAADWPDAARRLAAAFWPGPLTLIVPRAACITRRATAGLDTVGLRCPDHPLALALLREFDGPVAAPSANRSTRLSPTTARDVRDELGDAVDLVLDGGPCRVGIESTVLDLTCAPPRILRPGHLHAGDIARTIGTLADEPAPLPRDEPAKSPGQQALHYAPRTPAVRFETHDWPTVREQLRQRKTVRCAIVTCGESSPLRDHAGEAHVIALPQRAAEYAQRLYATLRDLDRRNLELILIELPPDEPQWTAVRDRLMRATAARSAPSPRGSGLG